MATSYIVRRPHFVRGVHVGPDNQHLIPSILTPEEIEERVANGAFETSETPDDVPADETAPEGSSRRRRTTGE